MFPVTDNPAARLLSILNEAREMPESLIVGQVFAHLFGYGADDRAAFYRAVGYLNNLVDQVEFRIRQIPGLKHDLYLRDISTIRNVVCPHGWNLSWAQYIQPLKSGALTSIEFCSDALGKNHDEAVVSREQLENLKKQIDDLYRSVSDSDLELDLKAVLFDLIASIRLAIESYKIQGADGLKRSVVYAAGLMTLHKARFKERGDNSSIKQVFEFVSNLVLLIKTAYKLKELGAGFSEVLKLQ